MHLLALQPYDTASHRAVLDGWRRHSGHTVEVLTLPGRHFKWRVRQAPVALAQQLQTLARQGRAWDALWCTSMLDLAALRGLCPAAAKLPAAVYFHENQLAYPVRHGGERDLHFGLTNMTTALAAIASVGGGERPCVWWNSAYNRDRFLSELDAVLRRMPDHRPKEAVAAIRAASVVMYPGIEPIGAGEVETDAQAGAVPTLLWAARWEHDKRPERFFDALAVLDERGFDFRLSVIGERFAQAPACFEQARQRFADRIVRWGYQPTRGAYEAALREADAVVSTAEHEFFGLAVAEAVSAGCAAVLPEALVYPELWRGCASFHDQTPAGIADAIERALSAERDQQRSALASHADRFAWPGVARQWDEAMAGLVG